ncbi:LapA family protein [Xanthomonas graminis]|uniref:Putative membrane protein n=1 Tax=Xanthomonas graminis pv. phlei TaxID=487906 RepID=A0A0K2ZP93_9XANT|nr:LapA family protein [Xanthomonas translucens]UKE64179.1 LapA family protein [Xanthomonas translucens pv. phlei]UKE71538.1 LapA family protein [Xanthomonas translucens pv. phleipratensis]CTP86797.1 putative membrane protein [Xanthomonas translucens pv. phlei]
MKIARLLLLLLFLLAGLVIGSLNSQQIVINFGFTGISTTSGIAIIVSLFAGVVIGAALLLATLVIPLYAKLRRANKAAIAAAAPAVAPVSTYPQPVDGR